MANLATIGEAGDVIRNLVDQIHDDLKRQVLDGQLRMGQRIREDRIAIELRVSRGVVREAVRMLEQERLVERAPHRGVFVAAPPLSEVTDAAQLRALMEGWSARIGGPPKAEEIELLVRIERELEAAWDAGDAPSVVAAELEFHGRIASLCGNRVLEQKHHELDGTMAIYAHSLLHRRPHPVDPTGEHRQMIEHLRSADHESFVRTVQSHYDTVLKLAAALD